MEILKLKDTLAKNSSINEKILVFGRSPVILRSRKQDTSYSRSANTFMFLVLSEWPNRYNEKKITEVAEIRLFSIFITKRYKTLDPLILI